MKILQINSCHFRRGGADVVYLNTGNLLSENGHQVSYFSILDKRNESTPFSKYFIEKKVDVRASFVSKLKNIFAYFYNKEAEKKLDMLLKDISPDIAHVHLYVGGLTSSVLKVLKRHGIPVVYTAHDYRLVCPAYAFLDASNNICEACKGKYFYMCTIKRCSKKNILQSAVMSAEMYYRNLFYNPAKYIDGFIYVSNFAKEKHNEYFQSLKTKKSLVLYNFTTGIKNTKTKKKYFLFFGRLSHEKGLNTLISAFSKLKSCELIIAGDGPERKKIEFTLIKNEISNIKCVGFVQGEALTELIANAFFVVVPSEWYENNPMTIVEAYRFGAPVIGANIGGIPEIINEGETGFLFESRDVESLTNVIQKAKSLSDSDYVKMCSNAINFSFENFNEEVHYKKLIDFYCEVIKSY